MAPPEQVYWECSGVALAAKTVVALKREKAATAKPAPRRRRVLSIVLR
jgi:hypothetical protein